MTLGLRSRLSGAFHEWRRGSIGNLAVDPGQPGPVWIPGSAVVSGEPAYWPDLDGRLFVFGEMVPAARDAHGQVEWNVDPVHGVRWPRDRWTPRIDLRGPARPGDVKYVWDPSRFNHAFDLCLVPEGAVGVLVRQIRGWIDQNRRRLGVHWDNGLEAALRSIAWSFADATMVGRADPEWLPLRPALLSALYHHAEFIERRMDRAEFNHLVADAAGLLVIGASYPRLRGADRWCDSGLRLLLEEVERQVLPDGAHVERAPAYARFVADLYLVASRAILPTREADSGLLLGAAERLLDSLMLQMTPAGGLPGYADDDGSTVLWTARPHDRLAVSLGLAAALTGRADFRWAAEQSGCGERVRRTVAAVLGASALEQYDRLAPRAPSVLAHRLADGGVSVIRNGWSRDADWTLFRCGPAGVGKGGHAHMDQLQVLWASHGFRLVDPGTPTYNGDDELRRRSTSTPSHNTAYVDDRSQAERSGRFIWSELPCGEGGSIEEDGSRRRVTGTVRYGATEEKIDHRRVVEVRPGALALTDRLTCNGEHRAGLSLLFADSLEWDSGSRRLVRPDSRALRIEWQGWATLRVESAFHYPCYGRPAPATRLILASPMSDHFEGRVDLEVGDE